MPVQQSGRDLPCQAAGPHEVVIIQHLMQICDLRHLVRDPAEPVVIGMLPVRKPEPMLLDKAPAPRLIPDGGIQFLRRVEPVPIFLPEKPECQDILILLSDVVRDDPERLIIHPPVVIVHKQQPLPGRFVHAFVPGYPAPLRVDLENLVRVFPGDLRGVVAARIANNDQLIVCKALISVCTIFLLMTVWT